MASKIGVYICVGYGIGEAVNIEELSKVATSEYKVDVCKTVPSCEAEDIEFIKKDIAEQELEKVVIAGPSPRFYQPKTFPPNVIVEYVNLREQVAWCQPSHEEDTQMMANDYLRMGIVKIQKTQPLDPFPESKDINKTVLVVGGGIAGLTAALETAAAGYDSVIVEKAPQLGGWMAKLKKSIPRSAPYEALEDPGIEEKIKQVRQNPKIKVHTSTEIAKIKGAPGMFDVELKGNGAAFRVGAIVQATGWKPYQPKNLNHLGLGNLADVITGVEMEEMAKAGSIKRKSDGKEAKSVVFVQCAGSRDKNHLSYCSSICCLNSLKQAAYVREQDGDAKAYIIYENLRAPGHYEYFYKKMQQDPGVFMTKGEVTGVKQNGGSLAVDVKDTLLGEDISIEADLVVLATGMVPQSADGERIRAIIDARKFLASGEGGPQVDIMKKRIEEFGHHEGTEILNLDYRQGPDMPTLQYGYPDSHFICFPYETRRTGIYAAGAVRAPMDGLGSIEDATGAAFKAIQCLEMLSRGEAVLPRTSDLSYPEFFLQRCTQCKRCTEECPFGTLNEDEKGTPQPNPTRCRRCGICLGACPERIINFKNYSVDMIASMIKAVEVPDEFEEKPRVLILACENDAYPAFDTAGFKRLQYSPFVRIIPVRCLGSVNVIWINEALAKGFDGVMLFGCKYGDDYQCHFIKGSELMNTRGDNVREKLKQMALENERVQLFQVQITDYEKILSLVGEFMETIEQIGMNPFKGM
ncbi:MAG: hydrogenase iron-sulfur subunit [Candidatus Abyssobacteria bacterium SURF_17]|uniref:Hydrogenase iron-sulfur subunit n=1 Tax=Candidatus Abyssobacteria bacterium SURF_17 TaxID=2093361 RepID=A0A419EYA4_9BACT|nr:MAG: hydrogenase iron-sulfur subunit [Candidatus Abyssubacteria bacterium SURF_17]